MARPVLHIQDYLETGKTNAKKIRLKGLIPSTLSSKGKTTNVLVQEKEIRSLINDGLNESALIDLHQADKEEETAFIRKVHRHPLSKKILNIEFYRVTFGEKIHTQTEIRTTGVAKGRKMGGVLELLINSIKIECLPKDIPEFIEVDVTDLDIGDSIHVKNLNVPEEVKVYTDESTLVVICHPPKLRDEISKAEETEEAEEAEDKEKDKEKDKD